MNIHYITITSVLISSFAFAAEQQQYCLTLVLLNILRSTPKSIWGKNTCGDNVSCSAIRKEALAQSPTNTTYHVYWTPQKAHPISIDKAQFYIHRYAIDRTQKNPALLTTNVWVSGVNNIQQFEKRYGITTIHNDNEMNSDFKASPIDDYTTGYYWDCNPKERRYTFLTHIPLAKFVSHIENKRNVY